MIKRDLGLFFSFKRRNLRRMFVIKRNYSDPSLAFDSRKLILSILAGGEPTNG